MKCLEKIVAFCEGWTNDVGCEARRLLADLQPDTAESVVRESVIEASDVVDRRQAAPHKWASCSVKKSKTLEQLCSDGDEFSAVGCVDMRDASGVVDGCGVARGRFISVVLTT